MYLKKISLKYLTEEYLYDVVALDQKCLGGLWNLNGYKKELDSENSSLLTLSILPEKNSSEKLIGIGCLWAILEEAHITILGIHPDFQGQGLGKLLLFYLLKDIKIRKLEKATLEVKESNQVAINLYQKFGFKIAGRRKKYYKDTGEDALILWLGNLEKPDFDTYLYQWQKEISDRLKKNNLEIITHNII